MLVTEVAYVKKGEEQEEVQPDPYMWITENDRNVYFQNGEFYTGIGEPPISHLDVDEFFWRIARKNYSKEARAQYGLVLPEERKLTKEEKDTVVIREATKMWKCKEEGCGAEIPYRQRGIHMNAHKRKRTTKKK